MSLSRRLEVLAARARAGRAGELIRYIVVGAVITIAAHLVYLLLLAWRGVGPHLAWALSFVFGTLSGYVLHRRYVFKAQARRHHWFSFPLAYLLRFWAGQGLLAMALWLGLTEGWAGFVVNVLMAPLGFVMLRITLRGAL